MSEAGSEMQGCPRHPSPLVKLLVEGFIACTACIRLVEWRDRKSIVTLTRTTINFSSPACPHVRGPGVRCKGCPGTKGPLVKLLVEGFHSPCTACIRLVEWRDRKSINFDPHNQPINFSSPACPACQRAGSEMQGLPQAPKGPLVKLLVEDSIAPARHAFVWSSGAIVNLS
jgi:hypothetical protein